MTDAVIEWSESNGSSEVVTDGIKDVTFGSYDGCQFTPKDYPIVAGENSFEKWLRMHISSNPDSHDISDIKVWMGQGSNPLGTTYLKTNARESGYVAQTSYVQPSASDRSSTYGYTQNLPTTEPTGENLGIGGGLGNSMQSGYSDYWLMQIQTGANDVEWQDMDLEYEYIEA